MAVCLECPVCLVCLAVAQGCLRAGCLGCPERAVECLECLGRVAVCPETQAAWETQVAWAWETQVVWACPETKVVWVWETQAAWACPEAKVGLLEWMLLVGQEAWAL